MDIFAHLNEVEAKLFLTKCETLLINFNIDIQSLDIDHLCYRVENQEQYECYKNNFLSIGRLLVESMINGRLIATYKLNNPIIYKSKAIDVIEVTSPKKNTHYKKGYEHFEAVIAVPFQQFIDSHIKLRECDPQLIKCEEKEIRLKLSDDIQVKFHHESLEKIIEKELLL